MNPKFNKLFWNFSKPPIAFVLLVLTVGCSARSGKINNASDPDRMCDCSLLRDRQERGHYLSYLDGEDSFYTGRCKLDRDDGNQIVYRYLKGHLVEQIESFPGGILNEELYYDTTGQITKRIRYYANGHKSYQLIFGDHGYEIFYENGRLQRKGGYGFTKEDAGNKYHNLYEIRLYDSIWKEDGSFDSVYHYSKASITY